MSKTAVSAAHPFDEAIALVAWPPRCTSMAASPPATGRADPSGLRQHGRPVRRHHGGAGAAGGDAASRASGRAHSFTVNFAAALSDGEFRVEARPGADQPLHPALGGQPLADRSGRRGIGGADRHGGDGGARAPPGARPTRSCRRCRRPPASRAVEPAGARGLVPALRHASLLRRYPGRLERCRSRQREPAVDARRSAAAAGLFAA